MTLGRLNFGAISEQAPTANETAPAESANAKLADRGSLNKLKVSRGNMREMIPILTARAATDHRCSADPAALGATARRVPQGAPVTAQPVVCLASGDGYLRAHLAGAIDARLDWPNSGTRCEGESRDKPAGRALELSARSRLRRRICCWYSV